MKVQISGMFDGGYVIAPYQGEEQIIRVTSDSELRDYLKQRGLDAVAIETAIQALRRTPRQIDLTLT